MRLRWWAAVGALWWCAVAAGWARSAGGELRVLRPPARATFYVGIAAPAAHAAAVRAFNRTLAELSRTYLAGDYPPHLRNITLQPLYIELPEDYSCAFELVLNPDSEFELASSFELC
ncbi:hypothetical protein EVAR_71367_1 [Eumeta japonica]|uniref:Uncharacterized protein n=1 Tax=Eumeta variegata TaxID=151549 RepID=A0A4C2A764_EUMVA|nr:hypothetical protein EVAR_71367_1 [Eumeta japonica]